MEKRTSCRIEIANISSARGTKPTINRGINHGRTHYLSNQYHEDFAREGEETSNKQGDH